VIIVTGINGLVGRRLAYFLKNEDSAWLLAEHLPKLHELGLKRLIAFSSTSVIGKQSSTNSHEREIVEKLQSAEQEITQFCDAQQVNLTILRPTLIYGYGLDENVSRIARLLKRFRLFPIIGNAQGLRQPVHCDDLARAALEVLQNPKTYSKRYNLVGGETLDYKSMVKRIRDESEVWALLVPIPRWLYQLLLMIVARFSKFDYTMDMVDRMSMDLVYDSTNAETDFSYSASKFLTDSKRDLP